MKSNLTNDRLKQLVLYDKETGNFYRIVPVANIKTGLVISRPSKNGYLRMHIDGYLYYLHRLAWFYETSEWPVAIDHIDGNKTNNKFFNLRSATYAQNLQNKKIQTKLSSGLMGAYYHPNTKNWQSKIGINGKSKSLGYYKTPEEAHQAYLDGKRKYHTFSPELRT